LIFFPKPAKKFIPLPHSPSETIMFDFSIISGAVVRSVLDQDFPHLIDCVADAYRQHHQAKSVNPDSHFLRFPKSPENRIIALPAALTGDRPVAGIKWIASYPGNIEFNVPRASAVLILNDYGTGYPFACMEASLISAARTAASAVLGAYWLNDKRREVKSLGIVGSGIIARNIVDMFKADDWSIPSVVVHDLNGESAASLVNHACTLGLDASAASSLDDALDCEVVLFATTAGMPYVHSPRRFRPQQIVLNVSLRDLAPELILDASNIVDDIDHCLKASTSPHLAEQQVGHRRFVNGSLGELMAGDIALGDDRPRIFSPFGMGILDLAVGRYVFEQAKSKRLHQPVPDFFAETSRWN
jgi:2,3-diaminopropionate biosynthesis protein SbnB